MERLEYFTFESSIVFLKNRIFSREIQRPAAVEGENHARFCKVSNWGVSVVHSHGNSTRFVIINNMLSRSRAIIGLESHCEFSGLKCLFSEYFLSFNLLYQEQNRWLCIDQRERDGRRRWSCSKWWLVEERSSTKSARGKRYLPKKVDTSLKILVLIFGASCRTYWDEWHQTYWVT